MTHCWRTGRGLKPCGDSFPKGIADELVKIERRRAMGMGLDMKAAAEEAGHPGYLRLLDEMRELHCRKAADYGTGKDPLANCRASAELGIPAHKGVILRMGDKWQRIKTWMLTGKLSNEGIEDTLKDIAAYALIALTLLREERGGGA